MCVLCTGIDFEIDIVLHIVFGLLGYQINIEVKMVEDLEWCKI